MSNSINEWFKMVNAMVDPNFYHRKVIEGNPFRLHVIKEGQLEGIIVKSSEGVLFTIVFEINPKFTTFTKEVIKSDDQRWLGGYHKEEKRKFLHELKHAFHMQVIRGIKGDNVRFFCPDLVTLRKWAKALDI